MQKDRERDQCRRLFSFCWTVLGFVKVNGKRLGRLYASGTTPAYNVNPAIFVILFVGVLPICEGGTSIFSYVPDNGDGELEGEFSSILLVNCTPVHERGAFIVNQVFQHNKLPYHLVM